MARCSLRSVPCPDRPAEYDKSPSGWPSLTGNCAPVLSPTISKQPIWRQPDRGEKRPKLRKEIHISFIWLFAIMGAAGERLAPGGFCCMTPQPHGMNNIARPKARLEPR